MPAKNSVVLDSYAVLAYLYDQTGAGHVERILKRAKKARTVSIFLNMINIGEVYYITARNEGFSAADKAIAMIKDWPVHICEADENTILLAARIKATNRLSDADAFAAATAIEHRSRLMTGDPEFQQLAGIVNIEWLE